MPRPRVVLSRLTARLRVCVHSLAVSSLGAFSVENLCHIYRLGPVMPFDAHQTFLLSGIVQIGGRDSDPRVCREHEGMTAGAEAQQGSRGMGKA